MAAACRTSSLGPESSSPLGEAVPLEEQAAIDATTKVIADSVQQSFTKAGAPARRDAHAKAHGCVKAKVTVPELPQHLRVGVFSKPATYFAWARFSNGNGTPQADSVGDARGMAFNLMGVPGKKLWPDEADAQTHDFVMINHPVFMDYTAAHYLEFQKDLQGGSVLNYFIGIRNPLTWHLKGLEITREMLSKKVVNPLEIQYFS